MFVMFISYIEEALQMRTYERLILIGNLQPVYITTLSIVIAPLSLSFGCCCATLFARQETVRELDYRGRGAIYKPVDQPGERHGLINRAPTLIIAPLPRKSIGESDDQSFLCN